MAIIGSYFQVLGKSSPLNDNSFSPPQSDMESFEVSCKFEGCTSSCFRILRIPIVQCCLPTMPGGLGSARFQGVI